MSSDLWTEASYDAEAETQALHLEMAKHASSGLWSFLALASSPEEYADRVALAADGITATATAQNVPVETLLEIFDQRFALLMEAGDNPFAKDSQDSDGDDTSESKDDNGDGHDDDSDEDEDSDDTGDGDDEDDSDDDKGDGADDTGDQTDKDDDGDTDNADNDSKGQSQDPDQDSDEDQGRATGITAMTQQVGITIGIPIISTLATSRIAHLTAERGVVSAVTEGVRTAIAVDAGVVLLAALVIALFLRKRHVEA